MQQPDWLWLTSSALSIAVTPFGGRICCILAPDKKGSVADVALGFRTTDEYKRTNNYYGAIIGRAANRICKGAFQLEGTPYTLTINNPPNHLHGGPLGFHNRTWHVVEATNSTIRLRYTSPHLEEGYPGTLTVETLYSLIDSEFTIEYTATTDATTVVNLSHHSFFNLAGEDAGDVLQHEVEINANYFTPVTNTLIPTGTLQPVNDTPFDFKNPKSIGLHINTADEQLLRGRGYDHNFVLNKGVDVLAFAARVTEPLSGRTLEVYTTAPGIQFYTGNFLDGSDIGKSGKSYQMRTAFCLEPQHFPDSVNQPGFPSIVLHPSQTYTQKSMYRFGIAP
jgi:aldose 1-epimerase